MTTLFEQQLTCAVCATVSEHTMIGSTNTFGPCDLDTRPAEMARGLLAYEIQQCPHCGYCAEDISRRKTGVGHLFRKKKGSDPFLQEYKKILNNKHLPKLARCYIAASCIEERRKKFTNAAWHAIRAAWVCDDLGKKQKEAAEKCRKQAIALIAKGEAKKQYIANVAIARTITVDLMRRAGMFKPAKHLIDELMVDEHEDPIGPILRYEWQLLHNGDTAVHTVDEVFEG